MCVLVIGSVALDTIESPFGKVEEELGGSATYFSIACSLFSKVKLVAIVGEDIDDKKLQPIKRHNIDLKGLKIKDGNTFRWHGKYFSDLNYRETVRLDLGVFGDFIPEIPDSYRDCSVVFLANIDPKQQACILNSVESSRPNIVAADTMDHWIENQKQDVLELLKKIDILILNDSEARLLSQNANLLSAGRWIESKGPDVVIIKKGEHGVLMFENDRYFVAPAYPLEETFDPTGAGDAFAGGFIGYISTYDKINHGILRLACMYGQVIASFSVEKFGVERLSQLSKKDIEERLNKLRKLTNF